MLYTHPCLILRLQYHCELLCGRIKEVYGIILIHCQVHVVVAQTNIIAQQLRAVKSQVHNIVWHKGRKGNMAVCILMLHACIVNAP